VRAGGRKRRYYSAVSGESDDDKSVYRRSGRHRRRQYTAVHHANDMVHSRLSVMTQRNETTSSLLRLTAAAPRRSGLAQCCISVCLSLCLPVCLRACGLSPKSNVQTPPIFHCMLPVAVNRFSAYTGIVYSVLRVLWTTSRLSIIG